MGTRLDTLSPTAVIATGADIASKADTVECGTGASKITVNVANGIAKLDDFFAESNHLLVQAVDAKTASSAANIPDRGVAVVDGSSGTAASKQTVTVSFAVAKGTELRMCELLITGVAEDDAVTVALPSGTYQFSDGADATKAADGNHFIFTEYQRGKWFVNRVSTTAEEVA